MQTEPTPNQNRNDRGSMLFFWAVIALAAGMLVIYWGFLRTSNLGSTSRAGKLSSPDSRREAPDFELRRMSDDSKLGRGDISGKVTVLHIWASWCGPCQRELPEFTKYAREADGNGVKVIALTMDDPPMSAAAMFKNVSDLSLVYFDPSQRLAGALGSGAIPETILIDKSGRIAFRATGGQDWSEMGIPALVTVLKAES